MSNLNHLLNGDYSYRNDNGEANKINYENEESIENNIKIEQYIQGLPFRYNLDFTDFLWELIISECILCAVIHTFVHKLNID